MHNDVVITVRDLRKAYREVNALGGVDLDIGRGEVFALLGPNGAGKTTTVEILEGFRRRDSGTVAVLGHDPAHPSREWRARIGIVLQLASTGPELTTLRKHAAAQQVSVRLNYAAATVALTVTDDGQGFDPGVAHGGYGLDGMRNRVRQVGGTIQVTSAPGGGTEVRAGVPG
jgi:ABC-type uncharacterized transport system ATPase subunit